jgi:hypothetical protein
VAAALASTLSGVFSACARLPACVRARSTTSAFCARTVLNSSTSGVISAGNSPSRRARFSLRTAQRGAQLAQRRQPDEDLHQRGDDQAGTEYAERQPERAVEAGDRFGHQRSSAAAIRRKRVRGLAVRGRFVDAHARSTMPSASPSGTGDAVLVDLAVGRGVGRHGEHAVPQRTRTQQAAGSRACGQLAGSSSICQ